MNDLIKNISTQAAILIGSILISLSILLSGGVITIKGVDLNKSLEKQVAVKNGVVTPSPAQVQPQQPAVTLDKVKEVFSKSLVKFGDTTKKLVILEVADPSCPYCHVAAGKNPALNTQIGSQFTLVAEGGSYIAPLPEIKKLVDSGKAAFAWIYMSGHGNGEMGTKAMYCGFEQDKFWEVHDLLMTAKGYDLLNTTVKNDKTKSGDVADFLQSAVSATSMKACLDSGKFDSRLQEDVALAGSLGVNGTPGFYVNTTNFNGAYNYKDMESAVNSALK